jgi:hypothetical protein
MSNAHHKDVPQTESSLNGGPPKPPKKTARAVDDSGEELRLTADELKVLKSFHKKGRTENWTQYDNVLLTSALKKAHAQPVIYRDTVIRWMKETSTSET